jgi:phosphonate transport system ATP-binding protein
VQREGRLAPRSGAVRARTGLIFQKPNLVGRLDLFTNVALGGVQALAPWRSLTGTWPRGLRAAVLDALARTGLADKAGRRASLLSGGEQQRGALARLLVQRARLVLADEPVAALDPVAAHRVMETLTALNRQDGLTVVVSLHQISQARRHCPRVIALSDGQIAYDGPTEGLDMGRLAQIYGPDIEAAVIA